MPTIYLNSQPWTITPIQWIAQFNVTVKYGNSHALHTSDYATLIGPTDLPWEPIPPQSIIYRMRPHAGAWERKNAHAPYALQFIPPYGRLGKL